MKKSRNGRLHPRALFIIHNSSFRIELGAADSAMANFFGHEAASGALFFSFSFAGLPQVKRLFQRRFQNVRHALDRATERAAGSKTMHGQLAAVDSHQRHGIHPDAAASAAALPAAAPADIFAVRLADSAARTDSQ